MYDGRFGLKLGVFMKMAELLSTLATCPKRSVGCVLTDSRFRVLATGYNGAPAGFPHCIDCDCGGATKPSGSNTCMAVHAEQNAILQCTRPDDVQFVFCTVPPCTHCAKQLLNTGMLILVIPKGLELDPAVANMFKRNTLRPIIVIEV